MQLVISKCYVFACLQANEMQMFRGRYRWLLLESSHDASLSRYENDTHPQAAARFGSGNATGERLPVQARDGFTSMNLVASGYRQNFALLCANLHLPIHRPANCTRD
jgi:hypothetical protein